MEDGLGLFNLNNKFQTPPSWKTLQKTVSNSIKMAESSPKPVENTVGEGEIAHYEQFLRFLQCFQKSSPADTWKPGLVLETVNLRLKVANGML